MKPFMAAVWFEGTLKDSEQVEAIARAHLSQSNWRAPYESEELGHWAAM